MKTGTNITIRNRLVREKRDINVYHHSTGSAYMICFDSHVKVDFGSVLEGDYLHISVVRGPGNVQSGSIVNLPSWTDFEFTSGEDLSVVHANGRVILKIPPGPPMWQLKITGSPAAPEGRSPDYITVGDIDSLQYPQ